jgi:hypothetical protein
MLVLIRRMILWMGERHYTALDFGTGGEEYKWRFADVDERLFRVVGSPRVLTATFVRGLLEERIRASDRLQLIWDEWGNRKVRGIVASTLAHSRTRVRRFLSVDSRLPVRILAGRLQTRLFRQRETFYEATADAGRPDGAVAELPVADVLAMLDEEVVLDPRGRARYLEAVRQGQRAFGIVSDGRVLQVCWLREAGSDDVIPDRKSGRAWVIADCVTARRARGQGLYPKVLAAIRAMIPSDDACFIYTNDWNIASQRGIVKAGFQPAAIRERRKIHGQIETRWLPFR